MIDFAAKLRAARVPLLAMAVAGAVASAAVPGIAAAKGNPGGKGKHKPRFAGEVFTETNDPTNNRVVEFHRLANGGLKPGASVSTGGKGGQQQQPGCTAMCPILDTQGELEMSSNGKLLFAVNAGSNTISAFKVTASRLVLVSQVPSGGKFPASLTVHNNLLYVLNTDSLSIAGFRFTPSGKLTPISSSHQPLTSTASPGQPRQIGFDNAGLGVVVTLFSSPVLDFFPLGSSGAAQTPFTVTTPDALPFAFAFDKQDNIVMTNVVATTPGTSGTTTVYNVVPPSATVTDDKPTMGFAPCWVVITKRNFAYVVNTGGGAPATVTQFSVSPLGKLTTLGVTRARNEFALTDETLSADNKHLYVLSPSIGPGNSHIDEYKVGTTGRLSFVKATRSPLANGASGLVGR